VGKRFDYVPTQLTKAFRKAQSDEKFQGWLKMQEAIMDIEFPIYDLPEVADEMFTKDSLEKAEAKLLELYPDDRAAYATDDDIDRTMRYVYYVGETFRQALDGVWVALPPNDPKKNKEALEPAIDLPFSEAFIQPTVLVRFALNRRTGNEIVTVFANMERVYRQWVDDGRPERVFRGTLRED
jgi:hypothetical protein